MPIAIIAVQAIPIPQERDKKSPVAPLVELTSELLAKYTSGSDNFDLAEAEADPRKKKDQGSRDKRSPVAPLVELTSELLAKYTSGSDDFDLAEAEADPRKKKDQASRDKRSPVAPLVELTSELLAKHPSGLDDFDMDEEEGNARVNSKEDNDYRHKRSEAWDLQEEDVYGEPRRAYPYYGYAK